MINPGNDNSTMIFLRVYLSQDAGTFAEIHGFQSDSAQEYLSSFFNGRALLFHALQEVQFFLLGCSESLLDSPVLEEEDNRSIQVISQVVWLPFEIILTQVGPWLASPILSKLSGFKFDSVPKLVKNYRVVFANVELELVTRDQAAERFVPEKRLSCLSTDPVPLMQIIPQPVKLCLVQLDNQPLSVACHGPVKCEAIIVLLKVHARRK